MSIDPKRIVEDEGASPLAAMLRAARDDGLTQEEIERIRAGLATAAIGTGAGTTAAVVKQTGTLASLSAKLGLALAIVGVAAGGAWIAGSKVATVAAPPAAGGDEASRPSPETSAHPSAPSPPSDRGGSPRLADREPSASSRPESDVAGGPPSAVAPRPPSAKAAPHPGRPTPSSIAPPSAPSATPANEGALLLEARRALEDDPARALELVRVHEQQFPNSQLAPERARIEAEAAKRGPQ
jgi:hypothetical protein